MKNAKKIITAFAVFASIIMLSTTAVARPVQEKTTMDILNNKQIESTDSIEKILKDLKNDFDLNILFNQYENNKVFNEINDIMEMTDDPEAEPSFILITLILIIFFLMWLGEKIIELKEFMKGLSDLIGEAIGMIVGTLTLVIQAIMFLAKLWYMLVSGCIHVIKELIKEIIEVIIGRST